MLECDHEEVFRLDGGKTYRPSCWNWSRLLPSLYASFSYLSDIHPLMNWYPVSNESADLTFRSLDNILFKIHGKYLEATSAGLAPPPSTLIDRAYIELEEPSTILEILFQFIHPPSEYKRYRQPDVRSVGLDIFFAVAEAAEKYIVFGAINLCMTRMRSVLSSYTQCIADASPFNSQLTEDYPVDILRHACKHGYKDLADIVAPHTLSYQLGAVAPKLTTILYHWVRSVSLSSIHESNIKVHRISS